MVCEEFLGEKVAIGDSQNVLVEFHVDANIEVFPGVPVASANGFWDFLLFEENALREAGILDFGLRDVNSTIIEIVVKDDFAEAPVFEWRFDNGFLEISGEREDLAVEFQPFWLLAGDVFVFFLWQIPKLHALGMVLLE